MKNLRHVIPADRFKKLFPVSHGKSLKILISQEFNVSFTDKSHSVQNQTQLKIRAAILVNLVDFLWKMSSPPSMTSGIFCQKQNPLAFYPPGSPTSRPIQRTLGMPVTADRILWSAALVEVDPNSKNSPKVEVNHTQGRSPSSRCDSEPLFIWSF